MNTTFNPNDPYALQQLQYNQTKAGTSATSNNTGNAAVAGNGMSDLFGGMDINALLEQMSAGGDSFGGQTADGTSGVPASDNFDLYNVGGSGTAASAPASSGQIATSSKPQTAPNAFQLYGSSSDAAAYYPNPNTPVTTSADKAVIATNSATPATAVKFGNSAPATPPPADTKIPLSPEVKGKTGIGNRFGNLGNAFGFRSTFIESPYVYLALSAAPAVLLPPIGFAAPVVALAISVAVQPGSQAAFLRLDRRYLKDNDKIKNAVDNATKDDKDGENARAELTKFRDSLVGTMKALYDVEYKAENNPLLDPATPGAITSESQANTVLHESYEALKQGGRKEVYKGDKKDFAQNVVLKLLAALDYKDTAQANAKSVYEKLLDKTAIDAAATPPADNPVNKAFMALLAEKDASINAEQATALKDGPLKGLDALKGEFEELAKDLKEDERKTATTKLLVAIEAQHGDDKVKALVAGLADEQLKTLAETKLTNIPKLINLATAEQAKRVEAAKTDEERLAPLQAELDKAIANWDKIQTTVNAKTESEFKTNATAAVNPTKTALANIKSKETTAKALLETNVTEQQAKKAAYEALVTEAGKIAWLLASDRIALNKAVANIADVKANISGIESNLAAIKTDDVAKIKDEAKRKDFEAKVKAQEDNLVKAKAYVKVYIDADAILTDAVSDANTIITSANGEISRLGKLLEETPEEEPPAAPPEEEE